MKEPQEASDDDGVPGWFGLVGCTGWVTFTWVVGVGRGG